MTGTSSIYVCIWWLRYFGWLKIQNQNGINKDQNPDMVYSLNLIQSQSHTVSILYILNLIHSQSYTVSILYSLDLIQSQSHKLR
jgi:hypothetical protein